MKIVIQLLIIVILTVINAFFAAAEMAMVSMDKDKIGLLAAEGNKKAAKLMAISKNPNKFLSTIQVGITLAGFFSSASAATGLSLGFGEWLEEMSVPFGSQLSMIIVTLVLSYFILVFGELFPKRLALGHSEEVALKSVEWIQGIGKVTAPFVKVLTLSINSLMKLFKINIEEDDDRVTEEKIRLLLHKGALEGTIKPVEEQRIHKIFEFDDVKVKDVMIEASQVYMMDINKPLEELVKEVASEKHSRIPIYDGDRNNILGVLLLKDLFEAVQVEGIETLQLRKRLQKPMFVEAGLPINQLFNKLQSASKHMVLVRDKYQKFIGIITIEDMIEEVFGEIEDEFDKSI